jgi:alpha-tubulin suppressor-like RCC1 family protein
LNSTGQVGDSSIDNRNAPVAVTGLNSGVLAISAGWDHTCAILNSGAVKCWGKNYSGQLGIGSTGGYQSAPMDVSGLASGVSSISGGAAHTCAIVSGGLKCWGSNTGGQLGFSSSAYSATPADVTGLSSGVLSVGAGGSHTCAVVSPSTMKCWGSSDDGEVGTGIPILRLTPVNVLGFDSLSRQYIPVINTK